LPGGSKPVETDRTAELDNSGIVGLQKQIMKGEELT
jgi:hypothetical protein